MSCLERCLHLKGFHCMYMYLNFGECIDGIANTSVVEDQIKIYTRPSIIRLSDPAQRYWMHMQMEKKVLRNRRGS